MMIMSFQFFDDEDNYHYDKNDGEIFLEGNYVTMVILLAMTMIKITMLIERYRVIQRDCNFYFFSDRLKK